MGQMVGSKGESLKVKAVLMAVMSCALWGSAVPFVKEMYASFAVSSQDLGSQFFLAGCRFTMAGLLILTFLSYKKKEIPLVYKWEWKYVLHVALYQTVFQYMFYYIGMANTSGVIASIIVGSTAFFGFFLSCFFYRQEKFTWGKFIGCMIGFIGILLCVGNGSLTGFELKLMGPGSSILSAVFYALSSCLLKKYAGKIESVKLCGYQFFFGGVALIILGVALGVEIGERTFVGSFCVFYLAMVSAVAYSMWSVLLARYSVSQITVFTFLTPIFGSIFTCIYDINELKNVSYITVVSLAMVVVGIIVINKQFSKIV